MKSVTTLLVAFSLALAMPGCLGKKKDGAKTPKRFGDYQPRLKAAATPAPEATPTPKKQVDRRLMKRLDLEITNKSLREVLLALAQATGMNLVLGPEVKGKVSLRLKRATLRDLLTTLLEPRGYSYKFDGDVLSVGRHIETRIYEIDYINGTRRGTRSVSATPRGMGGGGGGGVTLANQGGGGGGPQGGSPGGMTAGMSASGSGGGSGSSGGTSTITTEEEADFWGKLDAALAMTLGKSQAAPATNTPFGGGGGGGPMAGGGALPVAAVGAPRGPQGNNDDDTWFLVNPEAGLAIVRDTPIKLNQVERYLDKLLNATQRQVLVEIAVLEFNMDEGLKFGIDATQALSGAFSGNLFGGLGNLPSITYPIGATTNFAPLEPGETGARVGVTNGVDFSTVIEAAESITDFELVARPKITALNNQKAIVKLIEERVFFQRTAGQVIVSGDGPVVEQEPTFEANVIELGAVLDLTAQISKDEVVTLMLHPSFSELTAIAQSPAGDTAPEINRRELDTTVRVRSGDTVVISGLMFNRRNNQRDGIPWLGRIPFLGLLFRKTDDSVSRREMVLLISPRVQTARNSRSIVEESIREIQH